MSLSTGCCIIVMRHREECGILYNGHPVQSCFELAVSVNFDCHHSSSELCYVIKILIFFALFVQVTGGPVFGSAENAIWWVGTSYEGGQ